MKIGITCYPTYGGSGVVATELGKALAHKGHEVHFISYALPFRLTGFVENIYFHEVEMSRYPLFEFPLYSLALTSKMIEVATYENLDLLHVHYAIPHATSAYLAKQILQEKSDIKIITTLHGTDITLVGLEPSFLHLTKFSIMKSDGVTAVSKYLKEKTLTQYSMDKDIRVIPNFVDTNIYRKTERPHLHCCVANESEKVMVHISNFRPVKRVPDTIRILEKVNKEVPTKLILVGDGPDRSECERLARELGIANRVSFLGKQEGLVEILNSADLFLLPSQSESFGLAALEAMACGLPVIATSVGGIPEVVDHNETGYIAEIGDIDRMARYAIDLLTNERKYTRFSDAGLALVKDLYEIEKVLPQYEAYYEEVLGS